jgi:predicted nucleotidyltransferase
MNAQDLHTVNVPFRDQILSLARCHGVQRVSVFGSFARGEETESSDIDLLVDMEEGRSLFDLISFKLDLEELLGREVDVVSRNGLSPYLAEHILAEEIPL